jgi:hypothetical protein
VKEILSKEFVHTLLHLTKLEKWRGGFYISTLVKIETTASLESFRKFIIISTCRSFIPESYLRDYEVFPEREEGPGAIYIEAADKVTLKKIREMTFVNAKEILGIIYSSKSGNTQLKWRQTRRRIGKVQGFASPNALVNLVESGVLTQEWVDNYLKLIQNHQQQQQQGQDSSSAVTASEKTV